MPEKTVLRLETRPCDAAEAQALDLPPGAPVVVYEGLSLAGRAPIAQFRSIFPESRVPGLSKTLEEVASVTEALRRHGIPDYIRAETRVTAVRADATQALHLRLREGDPLIRTTSVNREPGGPPIEYGITWFAGDRVTLTVTHD